MTPLWEATRDLHHACEKHEFGSQLASGKPPRQRYVDWLGCLLSIHTVLDQHVDKSIQRSEQLIQDISLMGEQPRTNKACEIYCNELAGDDTLTQGAIYVMTGAHLMGGEVMRRRLEGYPVQHLLWDSRAQALDELKKYRNRPELADASRKCFAALLNMMDEMVVE